MNEQPTHIGRYEILERVGRGGMGVLYRGRDTRLDREVAIKVMAGDFSSDESARNRFFREAKAAARLQHRNVVTVFEFAEEEDTPYIVMEFLRGRSLAARLKEDAALTLPEMLDVAIQLCAGLEFAHREGLVHRDVKPGNIWICEDGSVKLLDFGIAKSASSTVTTFGAVLGSPSYMSPEQVAGKELDGRSDVFSAGVVLYEMLSGRKPFEADSPTAVMMKISSEPPRPLHEVAPYLPTGLLATVARALAKDRDARYPRAADLASDLRLVLLNLEDGGAADASVILDETLFADDLLMQPAPPAPVAQTVILSAAPKRKPLARSHLFAGAGAAAVLIIALAGFAATRGRLGDAAASGSGTIVSEKPAVVTAPVSVPTLRLTSAPDGAAISLDGRDTGQTTPFELSLKDGAPQRIRFAKRDHDTAEISVTEERLRAGTLHAELRKTAKAAGRIVLSGPYAFEVLEGQRVISGASENHQLLLSGRHTLRLRSRDVLLDKVVNVDAGNGGRIEVRAPGVGQLVVKTPPALETCTVWVSGVSLGSPPTDAQRLVEGSHPVQIKCPSGQNRQLGITVTAGELRTEVIR